jgi:hypothetical protein
VPRLPRPAGVRDGATHKPAPRSVEKHELALGRFLSQPAHNLVQVTLTPPRLALLVGIHRPRLGVTRAVWLRHNPKRPAGQQFFQLRTGAACWRRRGGNVVAMAVSFDDQAVVQDSFGASHSQSIVRVEVAES